MAELLAPTDVPEPDLKIVVPSYGRAGRVLVTKMLRPEHFVVIVPPNQIDDYREGQPELQLVEYPLVEGDMSRKDQWLCDTFGSVMILDDDLDRLQHNEHVKGEKGCNVDRDAAYAVFRRTAWETAQQGKFLFGYGDGDIRNFEDHKPFKMTSVVGGAIGLLEGSGLTFNAEIRASEDYWISCLNLYRHRYAWIDWRYTVQGPPLTFKNSGGMASVRTLDTEKHDYEVLKRYFGSLIQPKGKTGRAKPGHEWMRTMICPYRGG